MKKLAVIIGMMVILTANVYAGDWSREDTYRELTFQGLLVVDYLQTRTIVQNPDKYFEYNPIQGRHPSQQTVDIYMTSCAIIHPIISYLLPPKSDKWKWINRENWQYITIGVEIGAVGNNIGAGIGISF